MSAKVKAIRIIRHRASTFAVLQGGTRTFDSIGSLMDFTRKNHKVFAFVSDTGRQGICRSGRMMRPVDLIVKNVGSSFEITTVENGDEVITIHVPSPGRF
jgi:hypothetical protein